MIRFVIAAALLWGAVSIACSQSAVAAENNLFALVIGNSQYDVGNLKNPGNDARLMERALKDLGFEVTLGIDLKQREMDETIGDFCRRLPKGSVAFFFFAGHGVQVRNENYLIPVDANLHDEAAVRYRTVALGYVRDLLDNSSSNLNVLVLDCCRDNPFERSWGRSIASRGLAGMVAPEGTIIAYSTAEGETASDGQGANSPYTRELAKSLMARPPTGLELRDVFFTASRAVKKETGQRPWLNIDAALERFYLRPPVNGAVPTASETPPAVAAAASPAQPAASLAEDIAQMQQQKPAPLPTSLSPAPKVSPPLLRQASTFLNQGQYDLAIEAFGALISDSSLPRETVQQARLGRGASYLARRKTSDIERAIIDYQAAGSKGVQLSVLAKDAPLKVGPDDRGKVHKYEVVLLTRANDKWLWVESVQGSASRQGWISRDAFAEAAAVTSTPAASVTASSSQAKSANLAGQSAGPQVIYLDQNGRPIVQNSPQSPPQYQTAGNSYDSQGRPMQSSGQFRNYDSNQRSSNLQMNQSSRQSQPNTQSADNFTRRYMQKNGRPPSIWETPKWESPAEIRRLRSQGLVK